MVNATLSFMARSDLSTPFGNGRLAYVHLWASPPMDHLVLMREMLRNSAQILEAPIRQWATPVQAAGAGFTTWFLVQ
jgi:hypothetical protein